MDKRQIENWEEKQELLCFTEHAKRWLDEEQPELSYVSLVVEVNSIETCWRLNMINKDGIEFSKWWIKK